MKNIPRLIADKILSSPGYGYASIITAPQQLVKIHCHTYYEIFLVTDGSGTHVINSAREPLSMGDLYFIRPDDVHCYIDTTPDFQMINMIVLGETFDLMTGYLGGTFRSDLLSPRLPPHVTATPQELKSITNQLEQLVLTKKVLHQSSDMFYRITVFNLLTRHFMLIPQARTNRTPEWLRWVSLEMLKRENFVEGLPALYRLSGKSIEHLSRACRKYLQKSPTELVNAIRLEHTSELIRNTDRKILEICEESGFDSLSHFYHLFKQRYGVSPGRYRIAYQQDDPEWETAAPGDMGADALSPASYAAGIPDALPFDLGLEEGAGR